RRRSRSSSSSSYQAARKKKTSKKRKDVETVSASSSATRQQPKRLAREDSVLAGATSNLGLSSSFSSRSSYGIKDLHLSASVFATADMEALNVIFIPASSAEEVIPDIRVTEFPEQYILPNINRQILANGELDVRRLEGISKPKVQTFLNKLNKVVVNGMQAIGTDESFTDTYVDNLLRISKLDIFPLGIRNRPPHKLYIQDVACVTSVPDFVIEKKNNKNRDINIVVIGDKHLRSIGPSNGFGETQLAAEILASGSENIRTIREYRDQTLWAVRIISTYVTFYKALIPAVYWEELGKNLPKKQSITIQRWPANFKTSFDFAQPEGRREVFTALAKIREALLREEGE
ncbi:5289_t:CDS:2, partial [Paraglomus occultum]